MSENPERAIKELLKIEESKPFADNGGFVWRLADGTLHREYGPAVETDSLTCWYFQGQLHRYDGPASVSKDGDVHWAINNKPHRLDGPAIIFKDKGIAEWWVNGERHRLDGPAVDNFLSFTGSYWIMGKEYSHFWFKIALLKYRIKSFIGSVYG